MVVTPKIRGVTPEIRGKFHQGQVSSKASFIKIQHQEPSQDYTYHPSLLLKCWRTGMFLMELGMESRYSESQRTGVFLIELMSRYSKYPWEVLLKVSSRSNIRNLVKFAPATTWSLRGQGCSWWS